MLWRLTRSHGWANWIPADDAWELTGDGERYLDGEVRVDLRLF